MKTKTTNTYSYFLCAYQMLKFKEVFNWYIYIYKQYMPQIHIFNFSFFSSVQVSHSVISDPLQPHESQHARPSCPSQLPEFTHTHIHRVGDAIQPSQPLSSPSPPAPNPCQHQGLFPMSQLFTWGGQSFGVSASISVLPMNTQDWSPLGWTGWISLQSKGLSESSPTPQFKSISSSVLSILHSPALTSMHDHWKKHSFD